MIGSADIRFLENHLLAITLALPRLLVTFFWVQVFGASIFPKTFRVAIALGFSLPVAVGIVYSLGEVNTAIPIVALILKECFLGVLLGFSLSTPFWAIESVGALLDQQRGANTAQLVTPFASADLSYLGSVLRLSLIAFLVGTGGLSPLYSLILTSFDAWPVLSLVPDFSGFDPLEMIFRFSEFARLALLYSAPLLLVLGLIDLAFALVGLFSPQLPTYFASMPVKSIVGLFILALYIGLLMEHGSDYFARSIDFNEAKLRTVRVPE